MSYQMTEAFSQTSDEYSSDDESISEDYPYKENESFSKKSVSFSNDRSLSRCILSRLTSADIRQFVSPDYKHDASFNVPSLTFRMLKDHQKAKLPSLNSTSRKILEIKSVHKKTERISKVSLTNRSSSKNTDHKRRKITKSMLNRLCLPTLSFILKVQKTENYKNTLNKNENSKLTNLSPCERFNRRNCH